MSSTRPLALTMGEPAGVGGEITLKAYAARTGADLPPFFVIDDPKRLTALAKDFGLTVEVQAISSATESISVFPTKLPVLDVGLTGTYVPGKPSPTSAKAVLSSIDRAVKLALAGEVAGIVTNPIQKSSLYESGFRFQGHTDYIAHLCPGSPTPIMMLASDTLRVVPVTQHISLAAVSGTLSTEAIIATGRITAAELTRDFGVAAPRLAVAGLNPHAGESGKMGTEEEAIIAPAIRTLCAEGIKVFGPLSPDTMFHEAARAKYDAALCMYHDQALIPIKTIAFDSAVNVTCGLPIVRTSPDHGTALDIAGQGAASPAGLIAAIKMAGVLAARRAT